MKMNEKKGGLNKKKIPGCKVQGCMKKKLKNFLSKKKGKKKRKNYY